MPKVISNRYPESRKAEGHRMFDYLDYLELFSDIKLRYYWMLTKDQRVLPYINEPSKVKLFLCNAYVIG